MSMAGTEGSGLRSSTSETGVPLSTSSSRASVDGPGRLWVPVATTTPSQMPVLSEASARVSTSRSRAPASITPTWKPCRWATFLTPVAMSAKKGLERRQARTAMMPVRWRRRLRAAFRTRSLVAWLIRAVAARPFNTCETVEAETPASAATTSMVIWGRRRIRTPELRCSIDSAAYQRKRRLSRLAACPARPTTVYLDMAELRRYAGWRRVYEYTLPTEPADRALSP